MSGFHDRGRAVGYPKTHPLPKLRFLSMAGELEVMTEKKKHPEWFREDLSRFMAVLQDKSIGPLVAERLPLRGAPPAHELLESA
jgi:hypothetical protein